MDSVTLNAYAKINLFLEVCEKRPDSYHNVDSVMQSVSLCDIVTVSKSDDIQLGNDAGLPNDEENLAYKAAKVFFDYTNIPGGAEIYIEKNIPISAGLAGGSTDAAAVLRGLNDIYNTKLDIDTLCKLGSKLGADVPFCVKGGTFVTKGIGDIFTPCPPLPDCYIVVSKAGEGVSTPYAYGEIDKSREQNYYTSKSSEELVSALHTKKHSIIAPKLFNVFENVVCPIRPMVNEQKSILNSNNSIISLMSGSGPSVFGIFDKQEYAEKALAELKQYGADAHLCRPVHVGE